MKILLEEYEKKKYWEIEENTFDFDTYDPYKLIKAPFKRVLKIAEDSISTIGHEEFFNKVANLYSNGFPEACISTIAYIDPIYLIDFKNDTYDDYEKLMWYPPTKEDNREYPVTNGLAIVYDLVMIYNPDLMWCIISDRANEVVMYASNFE